MLSDIINGNSPLSLRIIDWFVTHHAKSMNVTYWIDDATRSMKEQPRQNDANLRKFSLYLEYRAQLQSYTKMFFDPFRRYDRITFVLENQPTIVSVETTVGQLNFFRWALENHVVDYILAHVAEIEDCMASFQKSTKSTDQGSSKKTTTKPKNRGASSSALPNTVVHTQCFIRFD
jgi:hypothetical protein